MHFRYGKNLVYSNKFRTLFTMLIYEGEDILLCNGVKDT
jgi:hypothetical protein